MTDTEWPTHQQELTRKTANTLDKFTTKYDAGHMSLREYFVAVNALYEATTGLIDNELSTALANIDMELRLEAARKAKERARLQAAM